MRYVGSIRLWISDENLIKYYVQMRNTTHQLKPSEVIAYINQQEKYSPRNTH